MNALAIRPVGAPVAPLGLRADLVSLHQVLLGLEEGHGADEALDVAIYAALGWQVTADRWGGGRRRLAWRCRSPLSSGWEAVPCVTSRADHAALLVPHGWDYSAGLVGGHGRGWCRERRPLPGREMRFFECNRLSPARALASAALFAVRAIAMEGC